MSDVLARADMVSRGFLAGHYKDRICGACKAKFIGDKHSWKCEPCAIRETAQNSQ